MGLIKGITVNLINLNTVGVDVFNAPITTEQVIEVRNVLVAPATNDDITNSLNLHGKKAVYTLAIPKGDTNKWEDSIVEFFGKRWHVFTLALGGIEENIPLSWNKKVMVEYYE